MTRGRTLRVSAYPPSRGGTLAMVTWDEFWGEDESTTWIVNWKVPTDVGVPEISPVKESSCRPAGKEPAITVQK